MSLKITMLGSHHKRKNGRNPVIKLSLPNQSRADNVDTVVPTQQDHHPSTQSEYFETMSETFGQQLFTLPPDYFDYRVDAQTQPAQVSSLL
jgi:hypothetical protein